MSLEILQLNLEAQAERLEREIEELKKQDKRIKSIQQEETENE